MRTLVLNSSYEFLGFCDWQSAICHTYAGKAVVLEEYDKEVHSVSITMKIPAVIRLKHYVHVVYERLIFVSYTKRNVHLRDNYTCQYCGKNSKKMTIDHVIPLSRGGKNTWDNTVSCCYTCNELKDDKLPHEAELKLINQPHKPHGFKEIIRIKMGELHDLWIKYL